MIRGKNWRVEIDWGVEFYYIPSEVKLSAEEQKQLPKELAEILKDSPSDPAEHRLFCAANIEMLLGDLEKLETTCREARIAINKYWLGEE